RDTSLTLTLSTTNGDDAGVIFGCWHDLVDLHCGVDNTVHPVGILRPNLVGVVFTARQHEVCPGALAGRSVVLGSISRDRETVGPGKLDDVATQGSGCPGYGKNRTFGQVEGVQRQSRSQTVHGQR